MATSGQASFQRACSLFVDELYNEALEQFTKAIEEEPSNPEYYVKRAACHAKLKNHTDALADANNALQIDPKNPRAYLRKGWVQMVCPHLLIRY